MARFDEVISQLCKARKCCIVSHEGNVIKIQSEPSCFYDNLAYFKTVCDCYMATVYHSTAWIVYINLEEFIIGLGYNY